MPNNNSIRQYLVVNFVLVKTPTVEFLPAQNYLVVR